MDEWHPWNEYFYKYCRTLSVLGFLIIIGGLIAMIKYILATKKHPRQRNRANIVDHRNNSSITTINPTHTAPNTQNNDESTPHVTATDNQPSYTSQSIIHAEPPSYVDAIHSNPDHPADGGCLNQLPTYDQWLNNKSWINQTWHAGDNLDEKNSGNLLRLRGRKPYNFQSFIFIILRTVI